MEIYNTRKKVIVLYTFKLLVLDKIESYHYSDRCLLSSQYT